MKRDRFIVCFFAILVLAVSGNAQTSTFTYQGKLTDGAAAANGTYQMTFSLFDQQGPGGTQQGATITNNSVSVVNGVFTVNLDFSPATPFATGADRYIEITVKKPADPGFTLLAPRQQVTSSPFATRSTSASNADSATTAISVSGIVAVANGGTGSATQNFVDLSTNQNVDGTKTFTSPIVGNGSQLTNINGANITNNTINSSALAADTFPNNQNLSRLGSLRWDLLEQRVGVGAGPRGVAFDGANIWTANASVGTVTKLRASDGACVGTCTFAVGAGPNGVVFDGTNIWTVNQSANSVTKLRASDGACVGTCTFPVGSSPRGIAFDGANIWTANLLSSTVTKLRASDGANQGTFAVGSFPVGIAFDGANMWVANSGAASNSVTKLRASDGAVQGTFAAGVGAFNLAFDGANMWVTDNGSNTVTKLRVSDGACVGTCTFTVGNSPVGIAFDGANIWVANLPDNSVTKLRAADGLVLGTFAVGAAPTGVAFDGANMWVTNQNGSNVSKLPVFP